jgi:hypothetical protein
MATTLPTRISAHEKAGTIFIRSGLELCQPADSEFQLSNFRIQLAL